MSVPDNVKVEIEFTANVWTDVTADVDWSTGVKMSFGRTTKYSAAATARLDVTLDNNDGRYTPLRQTLGDGTPHPYWPNVLPRKRIRYSWTVGTNTRRRFVGYIDGWPPTFKDPSRLQCSIGASGRSRRLATVTLLTPIRQEVIGDAPIAYFPLTEGQGATSALDVIRGARLGLVGSGPALAFGDTGPGFGDGTGVKFAPASSSSGQLLYGKVMLATPTASTTELWVNIGVPPLFGDMMVYSQDAADGSMYVTAAGLPGANGIGAASASIADGGWHHLAVVATNSGSTLYVDGVSAVTGGLARVTDTMLNLSIGDYAFFATTPQRFRGNVGQLAIYDKALSPARILAHFRAGRGFDGETVDQRVARLLSYGGLTAADMNLDASTVVLGTADQGGKDIIAACQAAVDSEGGASALYDAPDGRMRFVSRGSRTPGATPIVLDQEGDTDGPSWSPGFDADTLVNEVVATRATASGTAESRVWQDAASINAYGLTSQSVTSYARSSDDVLYNAQDRVAAQSQPGFRAGRVTVDMLTAQSAGLPDLISLAQIGSPVRVTNLPPRSAPASTLDLFIEGEAETLTDSQWTVSFDTSPGGRSPMVLDSATYGRLQCDGQTLSVAMNATTTTVPIATTAGKPTPTTDPAAYPMTIVVGAEQITLTAPPAGPASPQYFGGCVRGVNGTTPAAQPAGSVVDLFPTSTLAL